MRNVCIITARGGSKRIPRKNIRVFAGQPIIAYPIQAALASELFKTVMVSTDDSEIAEVAISLGAQVPFLRSPHNSDDHATTAQVLWEVLSKLQELGQKFDHACCCYPTSPFITTEKLQRACQELIESGADCVFPVCEYSTPVQRALTLDGRHLKFLWPEYQNARSQDLPPAYFDTGQFYFFRTDRFEASGALLTDNTVGIPVPREECQDIDNDSDWKLAEMKYQLWMANCESHT